MLFKRTTIALALATALLAVAPAAPATSADPGVPAVPGYDWDYYTGGSNAMAVATSTACWALGGYLTYIAFCPTCYGAGLAGTGACLAASWA